MKNLGEKLAGGTRCAKNSVSVKIMATSNIQQFTSDFQFPGSPDAA